MKKEKQGYEILEEMGYDRSESGVYRRYYAKKDYTKNTVFNDISIDVHIDGIIGIPDHILTEIDMIFMDALEQLKQQANSIDKHLKDITDKALKDILDNF